MSDITIVKDLAAKGPPDLRRAVAMYSHAEVAYNSLQRGDLRSAAVASARLLAAPSRIVQIGEAVLDLVQTGDVWGFIKALVRAHPVGGLVLGAIETAYRIPDAVMQYRNNVINATAHLANNNPTKLLRRGQAMKVGRLKFFKDAAPQMELVDEAVGLYTTFWTPVDQINSMLRRISSTVRLLEHKYDNGAIYVDIIGISDEALAPVYEKEDSLAFNMSIADVHRAAQHHSLAARDALAQVQEQETANYRRAQELLVMIDREEKLKAAARMRPQIIEAAVCSRLEEPDFHAISEKAESGVVSPVSAFDAWYCSPLPTVGAMYARDWPDTGQDTGSGDRTNCVPPPAGPAFAPTMSILPPQLAARPLFHRLLM